MRKVIARILAGIAALSGVVSAFLYVLLKQSKADCEKAEADAQKAREEAEQIEEIRNAENAVHKSIAGQEAEDAELVERMHSSDNLSGFNAGLDLLRKHSERGDKRNSGAGSSRA